MTLDLRTRYLGLELRSPIVASSSPLTGDVATARQIQEAGAGAICLPSLFEEEILNEEIQLSRSLEAGSEQFAEALAYFPTIEGYTTAGDRYLAKIDRMKEALEVPVIASINATTPGGWVRYARAVQEAGADALELNLYHVAADPGLQAEDRDRADLELIASVRAAIRIPLAVKLSPYYSAFAGFARQARAAGADGLVLFNRFYQPDLDLETFDVVNRVELSTSAELRLPLRWLAILRPQLDRGISLAATSGIARGTDAVKALAVGADVVMMTSALLRHGPDHVRVVEHELREWLTAREYVSVGELRGSATQASVDDPSAFERANYLATLHSWTTRDDFVPA